MKQHFGFFALSMLLMLTQNSCTDEIDYLESITGAKEANVPNSAEVSQEFMVDLILFGSSGCSEFSRFTSTQRGDTTVIELYQKRDRALVCSDNIIEIEVSIPILFSEPGTKYLKFNENSIFLDEAPELIRSVLIEQ